MNHLVGPEASHPRVVLDATQIDTLVKRLATEIGAVHDDETVLVASLKGSLIFASDLMRALPIHPRIDFVALSPFERGTRVAMVKDVSIDIRGSRVVLVTDAVDTGLSTSYLVEQLDRHAPRSLSVCTLIDKPGHRLVPLELAHVGLTLEDDFLIGYGLDFAGRYRNLNLIAAADPERLSRDPACYIDWCYRNSSGEGPSPSG